MTGKEFWPKEGKLKKGLIIAAIVLLSALLITLIEEKTNFKHSDKLVFAIALSCAGIWFYQPARKDENT